MVFFNPARLELSEKITPPAQVEKSMELQADGERKKRVQILASEGN